MVCVCVCVCVCMCICVCELGCMRVMLSVFEREGGREQTGRTGVGVSLEGVKKGYRRGVKKNVKLLSM